MGCPLQSPNMLSNERRKLMGAAVEAIESPAGLGDGVDVGMGG